MSINTSAPPLQHPHELAELTAVAQAEHAAVGAALGNALHHAMAAGDALLAARELVSPGQWQDYLRRCASISARSARVYIQVAKARPILERQSSAGRMSIAAALQYLRDPGDASKRSATSKAKTKPSFDALAWWLGAPVADRTQFLDGIGLLSLLAALSPALRAQLGHRVAGQRAAKTSKLAETLTHALRTALSLQQTKASADQVAIGVANALNGILNKLASEGLELHDVEIIISAAMKRAA
jgi:hypothetical protein